MITNSDKFNDYINSHPRESLWMIILGLSLVWQTAATLIALILYVFLIRLMKVERWVIFLFGILLAIETVYLSQHSLALLGFSSFIRHGFTMNGIFWKLMWANKPYGVLSFLYNYAYLYLIGSPLLIAAVFSLIDLISNNPHETQMHALQKGIYQNEEIEVKGKLLNKKLKNLSDENMHGTVLGVSKYSGKPVIVPDRHINQVALVLGTTGSGKTITLRRFYQRAMMKSYPLIVVDGKPDDSNIEWLMNLAERYGRKFFGFNCGNNLSYDSLANGGYTELKDKIICLKDEWENDYYRSIAEDYLQTTFEVLLKFEKELDLKQVVECLTYRKLKKLALQTKENELIDRVAGLSGYEQKDITGLQAHLNILIHSELGRYFQKNQNSFSLSDVIDQQGVVYFALPALRFPSFAKVLGKLVINDIKAVIDRKRSNAKPVFTVFDEFSVFASEQVLNLVNMGRGKGVHAIFGTQGLADLDKVDESFKSQVLNCTNTLICHRLNDKDSVTTVADWIGTQDKFKFTAQVNMKESDGGMGSVRLKKEYIVHPDAIKQRLQVGEAFYVTKVGGFKMDKVKVKFL